MVSIEGKKCWKLRRNRVGLTDSIQIAVDSMGGDYGPAITVPAACDAVNSYRNLKISLYGNVHAIQNVLVDEGFALTDRISIVECSSEVKNTDKPSEVIKHKSDSSLCKSIKDLADGNVDGCVSAGSTAALLMQGIRLIDTVPGIKRPAICATAPTYHGKVSLLDLGANVECNAQMLHQFAVIATMKCRVLNGIDEPIVKLLNIGEEKNKGTPKLRLAADLLAADTNINYQGFIEGDNLLNDTVDVIVCDGFAGNIALKTAEGVAKLAITAATDVIQNNPSLRLVSKLFKKSLNEYRDKLNPAPHNGAVFLGLNKILVKSHGSASRNAFKHAIHRAFTMVQKDFINLMEPEIKTYDWKVVP